MVLAVVVLGTALARAEEPAGIDEQPLSEVAVVVGLGLHQQHARSGHVARESDSEHEVCAPGPGRGRRVERAQEHLDQKTAEAQAKKFLDAQFTFEDFYSQLQQVKKMGPLGDLLKMIPGLGGIAKQLPEGPEAEQQMRKIEAIISSMTRAERADPALINGSRRRRIAAGSGTTVSDVNQLVKQFAEMRKMMKQMGSMAKSGRLPRLPGMPGLPRV